MEIAAYDGASSFSPRMENKYAGEKSIVQAEKTPEKSESAQDKKSNAKDSEKLTEEKIQPEIDELNKGVEAFNTSLHFKLHKETDTLMVRLIDIKTNEIIKEYPPEELLDKKAKIREFIGMILDDRA